jgi:hypothetical protein
VIFVFSPRDLKLQNTNNDETSSVRLLLLTRRRVIVFPLCPDLPQTSSSCETNKEVFALDRIVKNYAVEGLDSVLVLLSKNASLSKLAIR